MVGYDIVPGRLAALTALGVVPADSPVAVAGETGVREVVRNHLAELDLTMALAGHRSIAQIGRDSLRAA